MHKGASRKQALTREDLAELVDCYRRVQKLHASLNYASPQQLPLMAASATIKAAWAELSGAVVLGPWAWPATSVPLNGIPAQARDRWSLSPEADAPDEPEQGET